MRNPIYENKEDLEFIEDNLDELSKSIGSADHVNEYYTDVFKYEKPVFNIEAFVWGSLWFGYRKMYLEVFFISLIRGLIGQILPIYVARANTMKLTEDSLHTIVIFQITISIISLIVTLLLAKYANYIYFRSLKSRIVEKRIKKYGKSIGGAFVGFGLVILATLVTKGIGMLIIRLYF